MQVKYFEKFGLLNELFVDTLYRGTVSFDTPFGAG
jgi:hypothetical protein